MRWTALAFVLLCAARVGAAAETGAPVAPESPYRITADNMTGGRGPEGDVVFLNGNLRVTKGKSVLTADQGRYLRSDGMFHLEGHVRLRDSSTTVTCQRASFNENEDRLDLDGDVVIVDKDATLKAPLGWYDRRTGEARLMGGVVGTDKKQRILADEAVYLRDSSRVRAFGRVKGFDDENRTELNAAQVDYDRRTRVSIATGSPVLKAKDDDGRETFLSARLLRVDGQHKTAEAVDSVMVVRDTLRARADRAYFDDATGKGLLLGHPRAWDDETTVVGDTLEMYAEKRKLRHVVVLGNASMDYAGRRESTAGETSRLTGRRVDVFVSDNRIDSLVATGTARNTYKSPSKLGKTQETNTADGDTILVLFQDKKIDRARVMGSAKGEYRPAVDEKDSVAVATELIQYDGRIIEFVVPKDRIVLDGDAHLTYRDLELNARKVTFDSGQQTLVAEGKPQLVERGDKVEGQLMTYDMETRQGTIYQATTNYERGLYHGSRIRKVGDNQLDVLGGSYSTCDLESPHYHFSARWMKIYLKDKLVAKPVVFYLRNVPILALPFYVFPIKPGRHSGFLFPQFEFGFNNRTGQFLRNAGYYYAPNDYMDIAASGDYYQAQPTWVLRAEGNYKLLYAFEGRFDGRFERNEQDGRDDYAFNADHSQDITPRTRLIARGNFVSSREYNKSATSGQSFQQRLNRFLVSSISMSHSADWAGFNAVVDRRQDLDADQSLFLDVDGTGPLRGARIGTFASLSNLTVNAPSLSVSFPTRTLGSYSVFKDTPLAKTLQTTYVSLSTRFLSTSTRRAFVRAYAGDTLSGLTPVLDQQIVTRRGASSAFSISDSRRLMGWLNFAPSLSGNAVVFDFDELGHKVVPAATWSSALGMSTTLYRTFKTPFKALSVRHSVTPSAAVGYSPEFSGLTYIDSLGARQERFRSFGDIGISGFKRGSLSYGLEQRFAARYQKGEKVYKLDNLLTSNTSASYNLLWREQGLKRGLSPISQAFRIQPPGLLSADVSGVIDPFLGRPLRTLGFNSGFSLASNGIRKGQTAGLAVEQTARRDEVLAEDAFRESWRLSLAYSYSGGYSGPSWSSSQTANAVVHYDLTPNWAFDYSTAYDVGLRRVLSQRYSLSRRIHCWDAIFTRSFTPGGEAEYYFRLGIRDQREVYYERGSRVQSWGGIN